MKKYIDVEKLKAEIIRRRSEAEKIFNHIFKYASSAKEISEWVSREYNNLLSIIDTLQHEQSSLSNNLDEAEFEYAQSLDENPANQEEDKMIYDAFKAGAEWVERKMKHDHPKVDFEKELKNKKAKLLGDAFGPMNGEQSLAIRDFARYFHELGKTARKEE